MARATVCFNAEHDMAAIRYDRRPNDFPLDAINQALAVLYRNENLSPYLYHVYADERDLGILLADNFNPESDAEIRSVWSDIVNRDEVAPETSGPFARIELTV